MNCCSMHFAQWGGDEWISTLITDPLARTSRSKHERTFQRTTWLAFSLCPQQHGSGRHATNAIILHVWTLTEQTIPLFHYVRPISPCICCRASRCYPCRVGCQQRLPAGLHQAGQWRDHHQEGQVARHK